MRSPWLALTLGLVATALGADDPALVRVGEEWSYFRGLTEPSAPVTAWREVAFDDSAWARGAAGFAMPSGEVTGLEVHPLTRSFYFRKRFVVGDPAAVQWLVLRADYGGGFVAYLNGREVARAGLSGTPPAFDEYAAYRWRGAAVEFDASAGIPWLVPGTNVLAIQLHAAEGAPTSPALVPELCANFTRGPLLQDVTASGATIVWHTPAPADGAVEYGPTPALGQVVEAPAPTFIHALKLTGLAPGTTYCYRVRSRAEGREAVSPVHAFRTFKEQGDLTFAVFGDSGSGWLSQMQVAATLAQSDADLVLHTGDLIYGSFTPGLTDTRLFSVCGPHLRSTPYFPTVGNHDLYGGTDRFYLDAFHLPTNAVSGTEHYYSFDHGDAHFVCLFLPTLAGLSGTAAHGFRPGSPQATWLTNDLAASARPWKFLFLHAPLVSSGGHRWDDLDYDGTVDQYQFRAWLLPVARQHGVRVIFAGHDHCWERSVPTNGVQQVISGGGGYTLYDLTERDPLCAQYWKAFHHTRACIRGDMLRLEAIDTAGEPFDAMLVQRAPPAPRLWPAAWHTPVIEAGPATDGDGNHSGQRFDFAGEGIPALTGEFSSLGECLVNNDATHLYLGLRHVTIGPDASVLLFLESPRLPGRTNLLGVGNGLADPAGQGGDGLDFLENLAFTNFAPALGCILGDEYGDATDRALSRPGQPLAFGQGVFALDAALSAVPGTRLQQFNLSPQWPSPGHQGADRERNADFIEIAIPLAALGGLQPGETIKLGAVVGGGGVDVESQTRELDRGFLGVALHGAGRGPAALEGVTVQLAPAPPGELLRVRASATGPDRLRLQWFARPGRHYAVEVAPSLEAAFVELAHPGLPLLATAPEVTVELELNRLVPRPGTLFLRAREL